LIFLLEIRNTKLIIISHVRPIDTSYEFHASFVEPAIINVDKQQEFLMKIFFSSNHAYSEQIIVKIIDEERNRFIEFFLLFDHFIYIFDLVLIMKFLLLRIIQSLHVIHFYGNQKMIIKLLYNQVKL
jgi:hypothetical protein